MNAIVAVVQSTVELEHHAFVQIHTGALEFLDDRAALARIDQVHRPSDSRNRSSWT